MGPLIPSGDRLRRLLTLLTLTISAAYTQTLPVSGRCAVTAVPTQVRAEGLTERMGDIILQCSGSNPGAVLTGNLSVFLPVTVTNRLDANSTNLTHDAVLSADYGSGFVPTGIAGQITNQSITFNGISLTIPPSGNLNIKISNIRAADYILGVLAPRPILAQLVFSSPASIQLDQSQLVVLIQRFAALSSGEGPRITAEHPAGNLVRCDAGSHASAGLVHGHKDLCNDVQVLEQVGRWNSPIVLSAHNFA